MSKHTPESIILAAELEVGPGVEDEEFARLYAIMRASPDLLEALEGMMRCFDDGVGEHWNADELDAARAAIAKARGEA